MFTSEEIVNIAKRAFDGAENIEIVEHRLSSYSEKKIGFFGDHLYLELTVQRNENKTQNKIQLFVKALPQASETQLKFIRERGMFQQEAIYFNNLLPLLRESFVGEEWCPKFFLANDKVLVLEDLHEQGFAMVEEKIFDGEHLKAALRAQARLHAASLLVQSRLGKSPADVYPEGCVEKIFSDWVQNRIGLYIDFAERIAQRLGRDHRRISTALKRGCDELQRLMKHGSKLTSVICHGDSWGNNYLFDRSHPPRALLVDFQMTRYAPRMFEVAHLTYMSTTANTRKRELRKAIEAYHEELCNTLERNNPELERPSFKDLLDEYEDVKLSILLASIMYYPIIFLSDKHLDMYLENAELLYAEVVMRADNEYMMQLYDQDKSVANRLNELITEIVEYCEENDIPPKK